ncbi:hypothetical protein EA187_14400 [Lujinxingia sediminis]|uniref:Uncharacterized protein n=1 Tax=Lujinxingia sediminis TaxID=2480984 RepID=A0ABY0CR58_9DELT|nr:hypothetical protein [Lujinxingia sediminis]RVU42704.1 hypothetical protein EA187_14400 [Lujinxingia sediminis]
MSGDSTQTALATRLLTGDLSAEVRLALVGLLPWLGQPELLRTLDLHEIASLRRTPIAHLQAARQLLLAEGDSNSNDSSNVTSRDEPRRH